MEEGISHGLDAVRLESAIQRARVPRRAAYRLWENDKTGSPQDAYRREVLIALLQTVPLTRGLDMTRDAATEELARQAEALASGEEDRRAAAVRNVLRTGAAANFDNIGDNPMWRAYRTAIGAATTQPHGDPDVLAAAREGERQIVTKYGELFADFAAVMGLRLAPGLTMNEFVICSYALSEGLANRTTNDMYRLTGIPLPGDDGEEEWTLLGIGFVALVERFFEPIPDDER